MIKNLILIVSIFISSLLVAQNDVNIEFINETNVILNDLKIDKNTSFEEIKEILGEPEIYKEYPTGKINYHYADNGITLQTVDGKLLLLGFNYNWDGDKTFPESTFTGKLKIDSIPFDKNSNQNKLDEIKNTEFLEVIPGFIISKPKTDQKNILIALGFKDDKVTQIGFEFH
ncbi:DUF7738 domain-containing protein [Nonlabens xiamenensis]|uniref:DUF7738 domain-containing protein n=1 Tax=Nonlabens xiamenensis TaxID=2341043 RepID=UPI000F6147D9|nr:hypothetical protein [Nonlabens xiamenensis]